MPDRIGLKCSEKHNRRSDEVPAHQRFSSDWPNEEWAGYCRAVRAGNLVWISGSIATECDRVLAPGDMYAQSVHTLTKIKRYLERAGAELQHVVQTRAYLTDFERLGDFAKAHSEFFRDVRPVNTTVEISRLAHPDMLVEIEAMAVIPEPRESRPKLRPTKVRTPEATACKNGAHGRPQSGANSSTPTPLGTEVPSRAGMLQAGCPRFCKPAPARDGIVQITSSHWSGQQVHGCG
jgi:enamine deaminase RidA (YjgF/YER057c/UK114 family)